VKVEPALAWVIDALLVGRPGDDGGGGAPCVTVGVILRKDLNPIYINGLSG
jgi:hypothetical protein